MVKHPKLMLFAQLIFLDQMLVSQVISQEDFAKLDGLAMSVALVNDRSTIKCEISNVSMDDIWIMLTTAANGFAVTLYDANNQEIPQDARWARIHQPEPGPRAGRRNYKPLKPGRTLTFEANLNDAYGNRWKDAQKAIVAWFPGEDHNNQPLEQGRGITAQLDLTEVYGSGLSGRSGDEEVGFYNGDDSAKGRLEQNAISQDIARGPVTTTKYRDSSFSLWAGVAAILALLVVTLRFLRGRKG